MHSIMILGERESESSTQYYFGNFRLHARHPWQSRELSSSLAAMKRVDTEERSSVQIAIAKETGFTGLSILHRLHVLSGFDVLRDTVYDCRHNIPLNVVSHHLHRYMDMGLVDKLNDETVLFVVSCLQ